jgi:methionyl-tRNA formyltransferase
LHDQLADLAADVCVETLERLADGTAPRTPQDATQATYVPKLTRDHGRIDWSMSATAIERRIRAYDPWPGTHTRMLGADRDVRLKIFPPARVVEGTLPPGEVRIDDGRWFVGCGEGVLELLQVQPEGARRMEAAQYLRGHSPGRMG